MCRDRTAIPFCQSFVAVFGHPVVLLGVIAGDFLNVKMNLRPRTSKTTFSKVYIVKVFSERIILHEFRTCRPATLNVDNFCIPHLSGPPPSELLCGAREISSEISRPTSTIIRQSK